MDDPIQWNIHNNSLLLESTIHPDKLHLSRTSYAMYLYQGIGFFGTGSSKFREKKTEESSFVFILANIQLEITARNYRKISQQHCDDGKEPTKCDEVVMHVQFLQLLLCSLDHRYRFRRGRCCLGSFMLCGYEKGRLMNP